jgi:hypothetical protein
LKGSWESIVNLKIWLPPKELKPSAKMHSGFKIIRHIDNRFKKGKCEGNTAKVLLQPFWRRLLSVHSMALIFPIPIGSGTTMVPNRLLLKTLRKLMTGLLGKRIQ